jgi:hypothetical protein
MTSFAVTYEIVTPESAEQGDVEERGYVVCGVPLRDALRVMDAIPNGIMATECDECPVVAPRWVTHIGTADYRTGNAESRSLHMPDILTPATRRRIARLLGALMS